jgi:hypothetical protein
MYRTSAARERSRHPSRLSVRKRSAFPITLTDEKDMAAPANH